MGIHSLRPELQTLFVWLAPGALQSSALARDVSGDTEQAALPRGRTGWQELLVEGERQSCAPAPVHGHILAGRGREGTFFSAGRDLPRLHPKSHLFRLNSHSLQRGVLPE